MENNEDLFLAKWLNNDINEDEKNMFEASDEGALYKKIIALADELESPEDFNANKLFIKIKQQTVTKQKKVKRIHLAMYYKVAAFLILFFSVFYFWKNNDTEYTSNYGENLAIVLPDSSTVILNSKSSLSFNENTWYNKRIVKLEGEAFFKVKKGKKFTVNTEEGSINVLGTSFNINSSKNYLEVKCYTGKVRVLIKNNTDKTLTKGLATTFNSNNTKNWSFNTEELSWKEGVSRFRKTPFIKVLNALENQFKITFKNTNKYKNEKFTGFFSHKESKTAIKTVLDAMGIEYTINNNTILLK